VKVLDTESGRKLLVDVGDAETVVSAHFSNKTSLKVDSAISSVLVVVCATASVLVLLCLPKVFFVLLFQHFIGKATGKN